MPFTGGKGSAPSSTPSGFWKWEPSPCLTLCGGCLSLHWQAWRDRGADPWVVEVLREGYRFPFLRPPPLSTDPIPMPSYAPTSIRGAALEEVTLALFAKGAVELAPLPSPGFSSCLFVVWKTSGVVASGHRPVPAHSLRGHFTLSHGDHPICSHVSPAGGLDGLHRSSGGVSSGSCASGISSPPALCGSWPHLPFQSIVLRSVHGPAGLHSGYGSCIRCSSFLGYPYASLPGRLARPGIVPGGPPPGSRYCLVPLSRVGDRGQPGVVRLLSVSGGTVSRGGHRRTDFYGFSIARSRLQAAVYLRRILSSAAPPASLWQSLLGMLSSLSHLVPGGRLRMSLLQICLHRSWDQLDTSAPVPWSLDCLWDLRWWLRGDRFSRDVCLLQVSPVLDFWSDASDVG